MKSVTHVWRRNVLDWELTVFELEQIRYYQNYITSIMFPFFNINILDDSVSMYPKHIGTNLYTYTILVNNYINRILFQNIPRLIVYPYTCMSICYGPFIKLQNLI